jgi:hypothetical protein
MWLQTFNIGLPEVLPGNIQSKFVAFCPRYPALVLVSLVFLNTVFYPAMTAFTDQYSLPNIFFDIGQL